MDRHQKNINRLARTILIMDMEIGELNWHRGRGSASKRWYKQKWHATMRRIARFEIARQLSET